MTKLPDNLTLKKLYFQDGLSDAQIAKAFDVSRQAVSLRFTQMGIDRKPYVTTTTAILEAAFPTTAEFRRSEYVKYNRGKELCWFIRWRLGDPDLSQRHLNAVRKMKQYAEENNVVLALKPEEESPWVWEPRAPSDGRLLLRWPEGRERPKGPHLEAISLPGDEPGEADDANKGHG